LRLAIAARGFEVLSFIKAQATLPSCGLKEIGMNPTDHGQRSITDKISSPSGSVEVINEGVPSTVGLATEGLRR